MRSDADIAQYTAWLPGHVLVTYGPVPQVITLAVYETDEDLRRLDPLTAEDKTAAEHRELQDLMAAALAARGHQPRFAVLRANDYDAWRSEVGAPDCPASVNQWSAPLLPWHYPVTT